MGTANGMKRADEFSMFAAQAKAVAENLKPRDRPDFAQHRDRVTEQKPRLPSSATDLTGDEDQIEPCCAHQLRTPKKKCCPSFRVSRFRWSSSPTFGD